MSFADRQEQILAEAGRWIKGGMCNIKELSYVVFFLDLIPGEERALPIDTG
jgi:hypothetical protein